MTVVTAEDNADRIVSEVLKLRSGAARRLIAIAGPPAAGKSTVAELVQEKLLASGIPTGLLPMDGFHLDNSDLQSRDLLARKGAPETFDLAGFQAVLEQLTTASVVDVPVFDRANDRVVPNATQITAKEQLVLVEGNYLLLDEPDWRDLSNFWTYSVFLEEPLQDLEDRLMGRWTGLGYEMADALAKAQSNDIPNAKRTLENRMPASLVLEG